MVSGRRSRVAVIGGCGHVGLPLSIALAPFHDVFLVDIDESAVARVLRGEMPFNDAGAEPALREALAHGMKASTSPEVIKSCDVVVVVIGTPVDEHLNPSFSHFERVIADLAPWLRDGQVVVLRSTVYPGTSERTARWLEKRGLAVDVACCPERVAEGRALEEIRKLPQIISGVSPRGIAAARALFAPLHVELVELSPLEAELAKLMTNAYRYITFAVANQFYMVAAEYDLDFSRILHAIKHEYPRGAHLPGPGFTAGPCLLKDTMQLSAFNNGTFFLGHAAMLVNEGLPQFVVSRMKQRWPDLEKKAIGLLGMAFKADSDDVRDSLSYKLKKILGLHCREVLTSDPAVDDHELVEEATLLERSDIIVIGVPHTRYRTLDFGDKPVVDVWNAIGRGGAI